jgi:ferredoxin-NADP reductase
MVLKVPIVTKNEIAQGVWEIGFGIDGKGFKFKAGQYIKVILPEVDLNHPKGNLREFSITSSPNDKDLLKVAFRESDSDFKQALLAHSIGDPIKVSGPFGDLTLPKNPTSIVMIAGGMGITAFLSMLLFLIEQNASVNVKLIYINSKPDTTAYLKTLENLKKKNRHFEFLHIQNWMTKKDLKSNLENLDNIATFMIAGPPTMVRDTRLNFADLGISKNQILTEEFTGYFCE